jgi:hypothetical protein
MLFYFSDTQNLELRRQEREIKEKEELGSKFHLLSFKYLYLLFELLL